MPDTFEAFELLVDLCVAVGASPPKQFPACWELKLDEHWEIAFNGHSGPRRCSHGRDVAPFTCYVQFNGWPAGVFDVTGGAIAAGEGANEFTFLAALRARIDAERAREASSLPPGAGGETPPD